MSTHYRSPSWSDPELEIPNIRFLTFYSSAIKARGDLTLYLPDNHEEYEDLPLIVLLHGVRASHWAWIFKGGAHLVANRLIEEEILPPFCLAMPSDGMWGDGSGYYRHDGLNYENWIVRDVLGMLEDEVDCVSEHSLRFLCGLSMGGLGALRLGAKFPELFQGVSAHSALTQHRQLVELVEDLETSALPPEQDQSPLYWMRKNKAKLPPVRFDCGMNDRFIDANRDFHRRLSNEGIPHHYEEFPGQHDWEYWHEHLEDSLRFFLEDY